MGFVPTMGALHQGHISLIKQAQRESDLVVCSIFVNPTQFNDPKDLAQYPRPIEHDIALLESVSCDVLFLPEVNEIYDIEQKKWAINLGGLDQVLEGEIRPGHYQGVTQVVKILFDIVQPDKAFFGQKDYQQCLVIQRMVVLLNLKVYIVVCPTLREVDGLAMSSRNVHLSDLERVQSVALFQALKLAHKAFERHSIEEVKALASNYLKASPGIVLEYFQICRRDTLEAAVSKESGLVALVAARLGNTRLIDNMFIG